MIQKKVIKELKDLLNASDTLSLEFRDILGVLMRAYGDDEKALAKKINVYEGTILDYLKGISDPTVPVMVRIANEYKVSIDFLMGNFILS